MSLTRRISFSVLLALLVFVLGPNMAQAMCDPPNDGERSPDAENMGTVSLSADHNTLTITNAKWYPGAVCPDPYAGKDGSAVAFVDQTPIQISGPSQWYQNTAGPFYYTTSLDVSSLSNGTYSLAFLVDSTYGDPYFEQLNQNFTINRPPVNYRLTVNKAGTASGVGSVSSSPAGITCGADCYQDYTSGTSVTLTATPNGSTFAGWSGGGCSGTGTCTVTMNAAKTVTATFNTAGGGTNWTLSVTKNGTGTGVVSSTGAINCGSTCSTSIAGGNSITLYANPSAGSVFAGWGGACSGTGSCTLTMNANKSVTATFNLSGASGCAQVSVASNVPTTWWIGGPMTDGQPLVQDTPSSGRSYTTDTTGNPLPTGSYSGFNAPDPVAFGVPAGGWYGGVATPNTSQWCTGGNDISWTITFKRDGTCGTANGVATYTQPSTNLCSTGVASTVSGSASQWTWSCTGEYGGTTASCAAPKQYRLDVTKSGVGTGSVTSNPAGISCGADCTNNYSYNQSVVLTATPSAGETFLGWSGGGCSGTGTCTVVMTGDKTVNANFGHGTRTLTVTKNGSAASGGRVTSNPPGIDCGATCSHAYTYGLTVQLTPGVVAGSGAKFVQWGGACSGSGSCTPTMTMARTVTATYNQTYTLAITKAGTGTGTVTAPIGTTVDGISCGTNCSEGYWVNTIVTPTPVPAAGSVFAGWSGDADCSDGSLTMAANRNCTATFNLDAVACSPASQQWGVGVPISPALTASGGGGTGTYSWSAPAGNPINGTADTFSTTFSTEGVKTVTVTSQAQGANCTVNVVGTIIISSNMLTSWGLSGGVTVINASNTTGETYHDQLGNRAYTLIPAIIPGYSATITSGTGLPLPGGSQTLPSSGGTITFNINYQPDGSSGTVDLKIGTSDGPVDIPIGTTVGLNWDTTNMEDCEGVGGVPNWTTNPKADDNGSETSGAVMSDGTVFTLTCKNIYNGLDTSDSVTVDVHYAQCFDGEDNDGDGLVDHNGFKGQPSEISDGCPQCVSDNMLLCPEACVGTGCDDDEYVPPIPDCRDDGFTANPDNDNDGLIDELDPGCWDDESDPSTYDSEDDDERNNPIAQCNDTFDNDGDGFVDYVGKDGVHGTPDDDPECTDPTDTSELADPDLEEF